MNMEIYKIKSNYNEAPRQKFEVDFHTKLDFSQSVQCQSGTGRSDIIIQYPNRRGKAVIFELKVAKNAQELEKKCIEALEQIEKNKYDMELVNDGYTDILKYGIAFYKKDCMIKKM